MNNWIDIIDKKPKYNQHVDILTRDLLIYNHRHRVTNGEEDYYESLYGGATIIYEEYVIQWRPCYINNTALLDIALQQIERDLDRVRNKRQTFYKGPIRTL